MHNVVRLIIGFCGLCIGIASLLFFQWLSKHGPEWIMSEGNMVFGFCVQVAMMCWILGIGVITAFSILAVPEPKEPV